MVLTGTGLPVGSIVLSGATINLVDNITGPLTQTLDGRPDRDTVYRPVPGTHCTVDGQVTVNGDFVRFEHVEFKDTALTRVWNVANPQGPQIYGYHSGLRHCVIHDYGSVAVGFWSGAEGAEFYGNVVYYQGADDVGVSGGHGHSLYTQNVSNVSEVKEISENIFGAGYGWGLHAYAEGGNIDNFDVTGLVVWGAGKMSAGGSRPALLIGGTGANHWTITEPLIDGFVQLNYAVKASDDLTMTGGQVTATISDYSNWTNATVTTPASTRGNAVYVRPVDSYEDGRGHVIVFNASLAATVAVDLSSVLSNGDTFGIFDGLNPLGGALVTGTYSGANVTIPVTGLSMPTPIGTTAPAHPDDFGVFVVRKVQTWVAP